MPTPSLIPGIKGCGILTSQAKVTQEKTEELKGKSVDCGITDKGKKEYSGQYQVLLTGQKESKHAH